MPSVKKPLSICLTTYGNIVVMCIVVCEWRRLDDFNGSTVNLFWHSTQLVTIKSFKWIDIPGLWNKYRDCNYIEKRICWDRVNLTLYLAFCHEARYQPSSFHWNLVLSYAWRSRKGRSSLPNLHPFHTCAILRILPDTNTADKILPQVQSE